MIPPTISIQRRRGRAAQKDRCASWLAALPPCDRDELARLLADHSCPRAVVCDWCEEHGGQRGYRDLLTTNPESARV